MTGAHLPYVLITPARNEEAFIGQTIDAVRSQTLLPTHWVIVSDGSTDRTDAIVEAVVSECPWIELLRMPEHRDRSFAAKVQCFQAGYRALQGDAYDIIGNLDADITFEPDYFEFLIGRFAADPILGVAGTPFVEHGAAYDYRFTSLEHVSGACQLFRRACFDDIGGYTPIKSGGIDWVAVTTARMKGWRTRTFVEKQCHHHRPMGTASAGPLAAWYRLGRQDYYLGSHAVWQLCRAMFQMTRPPRIVGGLLLLAGYAAAGLRRAQRPVSPELVTFHRHEQMQRLRRMVAPLLETRASARREPTAWKEPR